MDLIFLAFANSPDDPLATLSREEDGVYEILSRRYTAKHFDLQRESHATLAKVAQYLIRFRDSLSIFLFSGHAGRDRLILEDQDVNAKGIADLLGLCPNLKLVILNGCSTQGQVAQLLALDNRPLVIATSAPVGDQAAAQFAISFFQALSEQYAPLAEAFAIGLAAAKTATEHPIELEKDRSLATREQGDRPLWGLFSGDDAVEMLSWMLPMGIDGRKGQEQVTPNQLLIDGLMQSLEPFEPEVNQIKKEELKRSSAIYFSEGSTASLQPKKQKVIIKSFPSPISSHLKTLFAPRRSSTREEVFYDEFNLPRLQRLIQVYLSTVELPAFFLLAQLWDHLLELKDLPVPADLANLIKAYLLARSEDRRTDLQFQLIPVIYKWLQENKLPFFFPELEDQIEHFNRNEAYYTACQTLESIRKRLAVHQFRGPKDPQIEPSCLVAEKMVTNMLQAMSFLANYSLVSIRNIDVLRNRQFLEPMYIHKVVRLEINLDFQDADPTLDIEGLTNFLHNYSILIRPKTSTDNFLNLTPFLFDENAFIQKTQIRKGNLKLYYFDHYHQGSDTLFFKHVDNFANSLLQVAGKAGLEPTPLLHLHKQIDAFTQLLFKQELCAL